MKGTRPWAIMAIIAIVFLACEYFGLSGQHAWAGGR
jgi:hypothetical protein